MDWHGRNVVVTLIGFVFELMISKNGLSSSFFGGWPAGCGLSVVYRSWSPEVFTEAGRQRRWVLELICFKKFLGAGTFLIDSAGKRDA